MLKSLKLEGFKCFYDVELNLNWLTLLTGLNNSGKSSVIQALRMLEKSFTIEPSIQLEGHGTDEEIRNSYHNGNISLSVKDEYDNELNTEILLTDNKIPYTRNVTDLIFPQIIYVSANRYGPKTSIPIFTQKLQKNRIGPNGENTLQCIEFYRDNIVDESLRHPKSEGDTLFYNIRGWLNEVSPNVKFDYKLELLSDSSYSVYNDHRATNVGYGLSYSLPVITALLVGSITPNCIVILENPEAHLHPKGQTQIARLISLCAYSGTQVIIETHSDHLFDGIRLASKDLVGFHNKVQIHWFELNKQFNTEAESPKLLNNGRLDKWPKNFFDQFEINNSKLL